MASQLEIILGLRDNASGPLKGVLGTLRGMAAVGGGILGAKIFTGIAQGLKSTASEALNAVADYERLGMTLESLVAKELQNFHIAMYDEKLSINEFFDDAAPKAQELLHWIEQLAIKSPFDQQGVAVAFRTAMAYGFTTDQARALTKASIDFAAATGGTSDQMNSVALALGQMQAKGKLAGQEILQLTNAGVNVRGILDGMGFTLDDVSKGLVVADEFFAAFIETMESDFGGAAERQSLTWAGLINTLEDVKTIGLREFFGGIFTALQPLVAGFADWLQGPGLDLLREWGSMLGWILETLIDAGPFSAEFREAMSLLIGEETAAKVSEFLIMLRDLVVNVIIPFVQAHGPALAGAATAIAGAFGVVAPIVGIVGGLIALLTSPITLVVAAVGLLGAAWATNWGGIREKTAAAWEQLRPTLETLWEWLQTAIPAALNFLTDVWNNTLYPALERIWQFLTDDMAPIWESLKELFNVLVPMAIDVLVGVWNNKLKPALDWAWTFIKNNFLPILKNMRDSFGGIEGIIQSVVGWIQRLIDKLKNVKLPKWAQRESPSEIELTFGNVANSIKAINAGLPAFNNGLGGANFSGSAGIGGSIVINVFPAPGMNERQLAGMVGRRVTATGKLSNAGGIGYAG